MYVCVCFAGISLRMMHDQFSARNSNQSKLHTYVRTCGHMWTTCELHVNYVHVDTSCSVTYCTQTLSGHHSPALLLAYEEGPLELHYLKRLPRDSKLQTQREQKLVAYFNSLL